MKTLNFSSIVVLVLIATNLIISNNTAHGLVPPTLDPKFLSEEFFQDLHNQGYTIIPSNTTEWFLWYDHYHDILNYSDTIFTGNITSANILNVTSFYTIGNITSSHTFLEGTQYTTGPPYKKINYTLNLEQYTVNVDEFLKNPQSSHTIIVREPIIDPTWHSNPLGPRFNVGDHVLFYVKKIDGDNIYSQMSVEIPNTCDAKDILSQDHWTRSIFTMTQNGIQVDYNKSVQNINHFTANQPIQFSYGERANATGKDFIVKDEIFDEKTNGLVSSNEFYGSYKKCEEMESAQWELSLKKGDYYSNISVKNGDNTFMGRYSVGFSVGQNTTDNLSSNPSAGEILISSPEFPFAIPILMIGMVSIIAFYRMKFR
jgi:hypothetical protein